MLKNTNLLTKKNTICTENVRTLFLRHPISTHIEKSLSLPLYDTHHAGNMTMKTSAPGNMKKQRTIPHFCFLQSVVNFPKVVTEHFLPNGSTVDADPFSDFNEMWWGEETSLVTMTTDYLFTKGTSGAFSLGPTDMNHR